MIKHWQKELNEAARPEKIKILSSFFKTGPGEYGEGDVFIGLAVPDNRTVSKRYLIADFPDLSVMLDSPIHEYRLSALLVMVEQYKRARRNPAFRESLVKFYIDNAVKANNWNVVQYAVLMHMLAQVCGMEVGELVHVIADAHIYDRHIPIIGELISRPAYDAPAFVLNPEVTDFYRFTRDDVKAENYITGPQVKDIPVAV